MDLSPALKEHAEEKAGKLLKYYDRIQEIEVVFDNAKDSIASEIIIHADH
jgi:ribosome-associated translation inhibitor RaiA